MFNCTDTGSGVSSCSGPGTVTTGPVGSHTYTVTATDNAGNTSTLTHTYNVYWAGFAWGATSKAQAGKVVNVTFSLGGNFGLGVMAAGSPRSIQVNCTTGAQIGAASATSGSLSYASGDVHLRVVDASAWKNTCRTFVLDLDDNTQHTLTLHFK